MVSTFSLLCLSSKSYRYLSSKHLNSLDKENLDRLKGMLLSSDVAYACDLPDRLITSILKSVIIFLIQNICDPTEVRLHNGE